MTRCIVHIGMHRTGSTSIQHSLRGISDDQFLYARLGDDPNHSLAIHSLFAPQPERHHLHKRDCADMATVSDYITKMRAEFDLAVSDAKGRTLIISGEDISALPRDSLVKLREEFEGQFEDVTVVGYVRAPTGLITSSFQHRVSMGAADRFHLDRQYRSYKGTFGLFDEVFGREKVKLWKFDIARFPEGCVVRDFCARLGIDLPSERLVRLNESLPRQIIALLYTYYKVGMNGGSVLTGPERKKLIDCLTPVGCEAFRISADVIKPILKKHHADIAWMEERLGQSLHEEIGEHRAGDIRDESDLLRVDPTVTAKLIALLGDNAPTGIRGETPEEVGRLVHTLRETEIQQRKKPWSITAYLVTKVTSLFRYFLR